MRRRYVVHNRTRRSANEGEDKPQNLSMTYNADCNIVALDPIVKQLISAHITKSISETEDKLKLVNKQIDECIIIMEMRELNVLKINLTSRLESLKNEEILQRYVSESIPLLLSFRNVPISDDVLDATDVSRQRPSHSDLARERIVDSYMRLLASLQLPTISVVKEATITLSQANTCCSCNAPLLGCSELLSGLIICSICCTGNKRKISSSNSKEYDGLINLLKAHKRYIGVKTPNCNIDLVKSGLDKHFLAEGKKSGEYYRSQPLDYQGMKEGTSVDGLCAALKALGHDDLYKYYMYIGHHYYGWKIPDLRYLEEDMIRNFRAKQEVWDNSMTENEKGCRSNLCTEYRLCREYQHAGYDCDLSRFKISRKTETLERYHKGYAIMCKRSGFEDIFSIG